MAAISASMVKELRERTGLGMLECKKALAEVDGDIEKAIEELRKKSGMKAAKKAGRTAAEGVVVAKVSADNASAMLVEINSETDFAAKNEGFLAFANNVAGAAFEAGSTDVAGLLDSEREALVQKIGENISPRRAVKSEGEVVGAYVHSNNRIASIVALKGGTPELARDIAMHATAVNPRVLNPEDMPEEELNKE
ncbi:elongation factor Ts, partial [Oleiphilus sp. HI0081]